MIKQYKTTKIAPVVLPAYYVLPLYRVNSTVAKEIIRASTKWRPGGNWQVRLSMKFSVALDEDEGSLELQKYIPCKWFTTSSDNININVLHYLNPIKSSKQLLERTHFGYPICHSIPYKTYQCTRGVQYKYTKLRPFHILFCVLIPCYLLPWSIVIIT